MKKISKILIVMLVLFLTFATTVLTFAVKTSSSNSDSLVISPNPSSKNSIDISPTISEDIEPIRSPSKQIFGIIRVVLVFIALVSIPVCIILGILYIKKSKSPAGKKIPLAILIFAIPYIIFYISIIIRHIQ